MMIGLFIFSRYVKTFDFAWAYGIFGYVLLIRTASSESYGCVPTSDVLYFVFKRLEFDGVPTRDSLVCAKL